MFHAQRVLWYAVFLAVGWCGGVCGAAEDNWGAGHLCPACSKLGFTADIGVCAECRRGTSSGAFVLCNACAGKLAQCQACRKPLGEAQPGVAPGGEEGVVEGSPPGEGVGGAVEPPAEGRLVIEGRVTKITDLRPRQLYPNFFAVVAVTKVVEGKSAGPTVRITDPPDAVAQLKAKTGTFDLRGPLGGLEDAYRLVSFTSADGQTGIAVAEPGTVTTQPAGEVEPPVETPTPPAPADAAAAAVHRYLKEIAGKNPDLMPHVKAVLREGAKAKEDPALRAALPAWRFFCLRFMQYPVGFPVPEPLGANNLFAVAAEGTGDVTNLRTPEDLEAFGRKHLVAKVPDFLDRPSLDSALRAAAHAYALLRQELAQDGFFRFEVKPETFKVEDMATGLVRYKVSASLRVVPGGGNSGSIDLALTFVADAAGGFRLEKVTEVVALTEGMRPICQSLKLRDADGAVRAEAERVLLVMGVNALPYLRQMAAKTSGELQSAILGLAARIEAGEGNLAVQGGQPPASP